VTDPVVPPRPEAPPVHERVIRISALDALDGEGQRLLRVRGVIEDRRPRGAPDWIHHDGDVIHRMEIVLSVTYPDFLIRAIEGTMATVPHPGICPDAVPPLQSLVGVSVARGFTRAVNERLGRDRGCTHVVALILAMGPVVRQGAGAAFGFAAPDPGQPGSRPVSSAGGSRAKSAPRTLPTPWFINSCQAWREGGTLHQAWVARLNEPDRG
jgi:hypothetical protein